MAITIFVRGLSGEVRDVAVGHDDTVGVLYTAAAEREGLIEGMFNVMLEGRVLNKMETLEEAMIGQGSEVAVEKKTKITVRSEKELQVAAEAIERLLEDNPDLELEVCTEGFVDTEGGFLLKGLDVPIIQRVLHILITDTGACRFIKSNFLEFCRLLLTLRFCGFPNLASIGSGFCSSCTSLKSVEFPLIPSMTRIDSLFFYYCRDLTSIDMNVFPSLQRIGPFFCRECSSLTNVDMSMLTNIFVVGDHFLLHCGWIKQLVLPSDPTCYLNENLPRWMVKLSVNKSSTS
eukprot:TRINITY_DN27941_c0_g1_i1.p1 TRINITY_DN27941_c0_g1~~TRINITY_DN27941_c0_g1_i1.p1  ORF type:complete len:289 (+),score=26.72 TRINITY_DN27941_c0_g1_i1:34-900(+)